MSASIDESASEYHFAQDLALSNLYLSCNTTANCNVVFMRDTPNQIKNKINKYAFSGGKVSMEEHREKGGDTSVDVSYQYLRFFFEDDDELEKIRVSYESGELLTGELKAICIKELQKYVAAFQERREKVDDQMVELFMERRPLKWGGNPRAPKVVPVVEGGAEATDGKEGGDGKLTKNQLKKLEKLKQIEAKKAQKAKEKEEQTTAKTD